MNKSLIFFALTLVFGSAMPALAQAVRLDPTPVTMVQSNAASSSSDAASVLAVPSALVAVCQYPANGVPCTNYATTYTDATMTTACPQNKQMVLAGTTTCIAAADDNGNFGFWVAPGMYEYTIGSSVGMAGPYFISASATTAGPTVAAQTFGIVCDGVTDSTQGFVALNAYLLANDNSTVVFPSNSTCLTGWNRWLFHVLNVSLIGSNTAIIWTGENATFIYAFRAGGTDFECQAWNGPTQTLDYFTFTASPIQAVSAGSQSVTVTVPTSISGWQPGDDVLVYGFDQQGNGFPPNYRYYDRTKIKSVNPTTGQVTLADPLKWSYNPAWPYYAAANTTPPSIRDFNQSCPNGGGVYPMQHLYMQGFDLTQAPASVPNVHPYQLVEDIKLAEFNQCKFYSVAPTSAQTAHFTNCTFGEMEIDKLLGTVIIENSQFLSTPTSWKVLGEGTGADYVELDNDEFWGQTALSSKTVHYKNCIWHYLNQFGFVGSAMGFWSENLIIDNPVFVAQGAPPVGGAGLLNNNTNSTATIVSVSGSTSFTISLADGQMFAELGGPGSVIYANAPPYEALGTVTDIHFNANATALVVEGSFAGLAPNQVIQYTSNPINLQMTNPTMIGTGTDINAWTPVWDAFWYSYTPNQQIAFTTPTTVADLGPCNLPSNGVTKIVTDASAPKSGTPVQGGGASTVGVVCQGINASGTWLVQ